MSMLTMLRLFAAAASRALPARDERGQATAEYALVLVVAAIIGSAVIAWAANTGLLAQLFESSLGRVLQALSG